MEKENATSKTAQRLLFPTSATIGVMALLVVFLSVLTGWKVATIETERAAIEQERVALEKNKELFEEQKKNYQQLLSELPPLQFVHQNLLRSITIIKGEIAKDNATRAELHSEIKKLMEKKEQTRAEDIVLRQQLEANRSEFTRLQNTIKEKSEELKSIEMRLSQAQKEYESTSDKVSKLKKEESKLTGDIDALKAQIEREKNYLKQLSDEKVEIVRVSERFNKVATDLEASQKSTQQAAGKLQENITDIGKVLTQVKEKTRDFAQTVKNANQLNTAHESTIQQFQYFVTTSKGTHENYVRSLDQLTQALEQRLKQMTTNEEKLVKSITGLENLIRDFEHRKTALEIVTSKWSETQASTQGFLDELAKQLKLINELTSMAQVNMAEIIKSKDTLIAHTEIHKKLLDDLSSFIETIQNKPSNRDSN